jgi:hypothetical protein
MVAWYQEVKCEVCNPHSQSLNGILKSGAEAPLCSFRNENFSNLPLDIVGISEMQKCDMLCGNHGISWRIDTYYA